MPASRARYGSIVAYLAFASLGGPAIRAARADADMQNGASSVSAGSYTRYTRRLEEEAFRILTPEISGVSKTVLAAHSLDLWGCQSIGEWRQTVLRWAPATEKALTVLVRRTEVLFADERVDEGYGSTILQLGSVHAMQRGLTRVIENYGVAAPAPTSAQGIGAGAPARQPTAPSMGLSAAPQADSSAFGAPAPVPPDPRSTEERHAYSMTPVPPAPDQSNGNAQSSPTIASAPPRPIPSNAGFGTTAPPGHARPRPAATSTPPAASGARTIPPAQSPYELAAYQGALARESYRILFPEIENGAQISLAGRRAEMRNAATVAEWKRLLSEANPAFAKAAAVLERRAEVLRTETKVLDPFESAHTQKAAVFGLQSGLEKILALYGK